MTSDLIIIGSGPGGYRTAEYAAKKGMTVTIFEKGEAGGMQKFSTPCVTVRCMD